MESKYSRDVSRMLDSVLNLFKDPMTRELHTRQVGGVKKFCRTCR